MKQQTLLLYILLATIATLPFASARFFVLGVPIYMPELTVIFASAVFGWIQWRTCSSETKKLPHSILWPVSIILIGLFSSAFFNGITTVQLGIIKSWFLFPMLFGWLVFRQSESFKKQVTLIWYTTLVFTSLVALVYFFQGELTYDGRLKAFYLSPNYLALFLFPGVFLGWYFITQTLDSRLRGNDAMYRLILSGVVFSWIIVCATLYFTLSYTIITASIIGFFLSIFLKSKRSYFLRITLIALCISFVSFFLLFQIHGQKFSDLIHGSDRSSLASRLMIWQSSEKMITDRPLIGIGPGNFQDTYLAYQKYFPPYLEWAVPHPHNLYLAFWLQTGIIGLIGFILLIVFWIRNSLHGSDPDAKKTPVKRMLFSILITFLFIGLLDTPYWKNDLAYSFWLLIALGL